MAAGRPMKNFDNHLYGSPQEHYPDAYAITYWAHTWGDDPASKAEHAKREAAAKAAAAEATAAADAAQGAAVATSDPQPVVAATSDPLPTVAASADPLAAAAAEQLPAAATNADSLVAAEGTADSLAGAGDAAAAVTVVLTSADPLPTAANTEVGAGQELASGRTAAGLPVPATEEAVTSGSQVAAGAVGDTVGAVREQVPVSLLRTRVY